MIHFQNLFKNFFETKNISDKKLNGFSVHHLGSLAANNGSGLFTTVLNDTQAAYNAYFGKLSDRDVAFAVQQSLTKSADNLLNTFKKSVQQQEGVIRSLYGKGTPTYQQFFPRGMDEYNQASKKNIKVLMERFVKIAMSHSADVGAAFINLFSNIQGNYTTARNQQVEKKGEVAVKIVQRKQARKNLEIQLCKNIYYIGFQFPTDTRKCMSFFDQSILHYNIRSAHDGKGQLTGKVTNDGIAIPNAIIEFTDIKVRRSKSKPDGSFRTPHVKTGQHKVRIIHPKFKIEEQEIVVEDKGDTKLDVELKGE